MCFDHIALGDLAFDPQVAQFAPFQISSNCRRASILFSSVLIERPPLSLEELPSQLLVEISSGPNIGMAKMRW
jgi:hypothetical protein